MKTAAIAIALALLLFVSSLALAQTDTTEYVVIVETANIHVAPHIDGKVLSVVNQGDIIQVYNEPRVVGWYRVKLDDGFGYIHGDTVAIAEDTPREAVFEWAGSGNYISPPFEMPPGHFFVDFVADEYDFVQVSMTSVDGTCRDVNILLAVVFPKSSSQGYLGSRGCLYVLEVESASEWSIAVDEITPDLINRTGILIEDGTVLEGTGTTVSAVTGLPQGFWKITMTSEGDSIGLTSRVLEGNCRFLWEFESGDAPITYEMTYRAEQDCMIVWEVDGGTVGGYDNPRAAEWSVTFEEVN